MNGFKVLFFVLLVVMVAWIFYWTVTPAYHHPIPQALELGNGFEGKLQLPVEKIQAAFSAARDRMLAVNSTGTKYHLAGEITAWATFIATALITLIVGFFGKTPQTNTTQQNTDGIPARAVRIIGLLAGIAAVTTAASNMAITKSQDYFKHADEIRDLIAHDRGQVLSAKDVDQAQAVLDDLALKIER
jgi:hypothetical protein